MGDIGAFMKGHGSQPKQAVDDGKGKFYQDFLTITHSLVLTICECFYLICF